MKEIAAELNEVTANFLNHRASDVDWHNTALPGKWTNNEIIGHLIDSAHINLQRFVRCTYEDCFKLIYLQEEWVKAQHYKDAHTAELLQLWKLVNKQIARVLEYFPPDRRTAILDNGRHEVSFISVESVAKDYIAHMQHHLNQIF